MDSPTSYAQRFMDGPTARPEIIRWKRQWWGNDRVVWVIVRKVDASWRGDREDYLPPGTCTNNRVGRWFVKLAAMKERVPMPHIGYYDGRVSFTDGRHRFGWCRDNGVKAMPVSVESKSQAKLVGRLFGSRSRVCRVPRRSGSAAPPYDRPTRAESI